VSLHWTENDDLLSEYVLGRVPAQDLNRLEAHLASCSVCQEAVRLERAMASGIRRYGREEFKARLGTMIAQRPVSINRLVTWQRAVSVAAVFVVIAGIGILNGWFTTGQRGLFSSHAEDSVREQKESVTHLPQQTEEGWLQAESKGGKMALGKVKTDRIEKPKQSFAPESDQGARSSEGATGVTGKDKAVAAAGEDLDKMNTITGSRAHAQELWAEGGSLTSLQLFREKSGTAKKLLSRAEPSTRQQPGGAGAQNAVVAQSFPAGQGIEFRQSTVELLPIARQRVAKDEPSQVQTLFQRTGRGTDITLYLDTLLSEEDLRYASVTRVAPDSIVVEIKSKRLGYRLPATFLDSILGKREKE
jgi:hypothetical protein